MKYVLLELAWKPRSVCVTSVSAAPHCLDTLCISGYISVFDIASRAKQTLFDWGTQVPKQVLGADEPAAMIAALLVERS